MPATAPSLSIGQLATATGVSVRSLRHYEAQGLLAAGRGTNGYRHFSVSAVAQVRQLQRLLGAGFSLAEIRGFPDCMRLIEGPGLPGDLGCPARAPGELGASDR